MFKLMEPLQKLFKLKEIDIYNNIFKLHTKVTVIFLLFFVCLLSAYEFFGKPIDCIINDVNSKVAFLDKYCWIHGTYIVRNFNAFGKLFSYIVLNPNARFAGSYFFNMIISVNPTLMFR